MLRQRVGRTAPRGAVRPALVLTGVLAVTVVLALGIGPVSIPAHRVVDVLLQRLGTGVHSTVLDDQIVWELRFPRVLGAAATGAALALCGAVLQSLTRNDLADPYLLGLSNGAAVGAVSVIVLGVGLSGLVPTTAIALGSFAGAVVAMVLVLGLATSRDGSLPPARTVLAGVAVGQVCAAYTSFVVIVSGDHDAARRVLSWTLGSLAGLRWGQTTFLVLVALLAVVLVMACASDLDAFAFGEASAGALGVSVTTMRWVLLVGTALVTASLVAFTGAIGFVGLVVPHAVRLVWGPLHRRLLPLSALVGAILLVWADTLARTVVPGQEIPIGVVTAVVGAPVFAWLLRREGRPA